MAHNLFDIAKKILPKDSYNIIRKISGDQKKELIRYALLNALEDKYNLLDKKIAYLKLNGTDYFFPNNYLSLVKGKIDYLKVNFSEHKVIIILNLINKIEKEVSGLNV